MAIQENFKGIDYDHENRHLEPGFTRENWNTRINSSLGTNKGAIENIMGNIQMPNPFLPTGDNSTVGAYEDKKGNSIITLNSNSNSNHGIYQYFPDRNSNQWEIVKIDPLFDFQPDHFVIDINLVENLLYFHDDRISPKKIDISKANDTGKLISFNIYFGDGKTNIFAIAGTTWGFTYTTADSVVHNFPLLFVNPGFSTFADAVSEFASRMKLAFPSWSVISNGSFISVISAIGSSPIIDVSALSSTGQEWVIIQNSYAIPFSLNYIEVIKYPPHYPINPVPRFDNLRATNNIQGLPLQFRYKYIYDNNEESVWSTYSVLALDNKSAITDMLQSKNNCVDLDYSDGGLLFTTNYRNAIKKVAISFRIGNTGKEQQIIVLDQFELTGTYTFYNDGLGAPVTDAEVAEPYHAVPLVVGAQEIGKDRMFFGDNLEGYDEVGIDMDIDIEINDTPGGDTWTLVGYAVIKNVLRNEYDSVFNTDGNTTDFFYGADVISGSNADRVARAKRMQQYLGTSGFTIYLAGTEFSATTVDMADPGGAAGNPFGASRIQKFLFTGIPSGTYILRWASNYCGPTDQFGHQYNTGNLDLSWQRTSLPIVEAFGGDPASTGSYELKIILGNPAPGGSIYDLTGATGVAHSAYPDKGYSIIADLSYLEIHGGISGYTIKAAASWGYLVYDTNNTNTAANMVGGLRIEGQQLLVDVGPYYPGALPNIQFSEYSDHNGFVWLAGAYVSAATILSGLTVTPPFYKFSVLGPESFVIIKSPLTQFYLGSLFFDPSLLVLKSNISPSDVTNEIVLYSGPVNSYFTYVIGRVSDQYGSVFSFAKFVLEHGTIGQADVDGNFKFPIFMTAYTTPPGRKTDLLYIEGGVGFNPFITAFTGDAHGQAITFDSTHPFYASFGSIFTIGPFTGHSKSDITQVSFIVQLAALLISSLKRGGSFQLGVVYFDEGDRKTAVCANQKTLSYIPAQAQDLGVFIPSRYPLGTQKGGQALTHWSINNPAPTWATHYAIVRTTDQNLNRYFQIAICGALYLLFFDTNAPNPLNQITAWDSGLAKQIYIDISSLLLFTQENTYSFTANSTANNTPYLSYIYQKGDRIQFISDASTGANILFSKLYDLEIKGQYKNFIIIDYLVDLPEIIQGMIVEIYTPKKDGAIKTFYEIGETYPILTDGQGRKYHVGPDQTQDITTGFPAKGTLKRGDTYYRKRDMPTLNTQTSTSHRYNLYIEDPSISDFFDSYCSDIGRPSIIDKDIKQTRRNNGYRFSDKIILGTNQNGLSAFHQLNNGTLDAINGNIVSLEMLDYIMLAIQEFEVTSMYIETQVTYQSQGNQEIISISDQVVSNKTPLKKEQGSQDKGSIIRESGRVYFWNRYKGTYNRYSDNGVTILSSTYNSILYFREFTDLLSGKNKVLKGNGYYTVDSIHASSVFDRKHKEVLLTVNYHVIQYASDGTVIDDFTDGRTIACYDEPEKEITYFTTRYNFIPKVYSQNKNNITSFFVDGEMWEHEQNAIFGSFYGSIFDQKVILVFADLPGAIKFYKSMAIHSNNQWRVFITTPATTENPTGQRSELMETDFEEKEGIYSASFFQNMDTPNFTDQFEALANGENLRGYAIILELVNSNTTETVLYAVEVSSGNSSLVLS